MSWSYVELSEVSDRAPELMRADGFRCYDAVHAASLTVAGLGDMVTRDHGFAAMPQTVCDLECVVLVQEQPRPVQAWT